MKEPSKNPTAAPDPVGLNRTIEQAKQQLEQMIDLNPQVMLFVDRHGKVVRANKALLNLLGLNSFREVLNRPLADLFHCSDADYFQKMIAQAGGYHVCESPIELPDKTSRQFRFTIVGSGKDSDLYVLIVHDITDEAEHARLAEKEHKKQAIQTLVGALMHSLNQPLTVIMLRVQLMLLAIEKGSVDAEEFGQSLQDIMRLTIQIAETLRHVQEPKDYVTTPYLEGVDILDLERSGDGSRLHSYSQILLDAFMTALEAHSPGSTDHARRTAGYASCLARNMGLTDREVGTASRSGFFHDIGKIGIPDSVLQKPDGLTPEETKIMRRHPQIGYDLLRGFPFLQIEAEAIHAHHEWFDGAGYPRKLKGTEIPLLARIVAVADAFDILRSGRAYQTALSPTETRKKVLASSGTQFDPDVVDAFESCSAELNALFEKNA